MILRVFLDLNVTVLKERSKTPNSFDRMSGCGHKESSVLENVLKIVMTED